MKFISFSRSEIFSLKKSPERSSALRKTLNFEFYVNAHCLFFASGSLQNDDTKTKIKKSTMRAPESLTIDLKFLAYINTKLEIILKQNGCNCVKSFLLFHIRIYKVFICFYICKLKFLLNRFKNTTITNKTFFI